MTNLTRFFVCSILAVTAACANRINGNDLSQLNNGSKLLGSWQALSYKDGKSNVEAKADESGYLGMQSTDKSGASEATYLKMFVTFDGSKTKTIFVVIRVGPTQEREHQNDHTDNHNSFIIGLPLFNQIRSQQNKNTAQNRQIEPVFMFNKAQD